MNDTWLYRIDEAYETPLSRAENSNHGMLTELLLQQERADREMNTGDSELIHRAAAMGLENVVATLLSDGVHPDICDRSGETALHKAVRNGHEWVVRRLTESGADANATSVHGLTPLHWAALTGNAEIAEILLDAGGDAMVPAPHLDGLTPLSLAKSMGYRDVVSRLTRLAAA